MIILGLDPGLARLGFGIIEQKENQLFLLQCGIIETKAEKSTGERLDIIYRNMQKLLNSFEIDRCGIEKLFAGKNIKTGMDVAQARGIMILALQQKGIPYQEFSPPEVKKAVSGSGKASKPVIQSFIQSMLKLESPPEPDDAADAVGIALAAAKFHDQY